jgi:hypothetical protein
MSSSRRLGAYPEVRQQTLGLALQTKLLELLSIPRAHFLRTMICMSNWSGDNYAIRTPDQTRGPGAGFPDR